MVNQERDPRVIAAGRDTEIVDLGGGRVLRRPFDGRDLSAEAAVMEAVVAAGYPAPRPHEVRADGIVMDRLAGMSMLDDLGRRPWHLDRHARTLAELQRRLASVPPPPGLTEPFGPAESLLHLDFHPGNVMLTDTGPVVIDWTNAARGPAPADVAFSWLLLGAAEPPESGWAGRALVAAGRHQLVRRYLAHADRDAASRFLPAAVEYRRADRNSTESELVRMQAIADRWGRWPAAPPERSVSPTSPPAPGGHGGLGGPGRRARR